MCDSFEKIISLLANIATILGAILAFVVWSTWKEQQNYSFTRDKIFECELAFAKLITAIENYLRIYEKEVPFSRNRINRTNLELTNVLLGEARKELDQLWGKYEIALYSLEVLNIKYKKECLANVSVIQNRLEKYKQTFNNSLTSEEVKSSSEDIFGRLANEKANGLEELRKIRLKQ